MKNVKKLVTITLIIVLCVLVYYRYANKDTADTEKTDTSNQLSEVEKILTKDLETSYPSTPLQVVKFFTRIQKCYYNEDNTDAVVEQLADMSRQLFDESLLEKNPVEDYYKKLKDEIADYKKDKRTIENIIYDKTADILYGEVNGQKTAELKCTYYIQTGKHLSTTVETYVLRKDDEGRWKIYGWQLDEPSEFEE